MKKYLLFLILPILFIACEDSEINDYAVARACLDHATASTAQSCVASFANSNSQRANKLKCAASFIEQGLDTSRLANIFSDMQGDGSGDFKSFGSALIFEGSDATDAKTKAKEAFDYCKNSGSSGMSMFGSVAYSVTSLAVSAGGWDGTYDNAPDLGAAPNTGQTEAGEAVLNIKDLYCGEGSSQDELCGHINQVITNAGSNDPTDVGDALAAYLD